MRKHAPKRTIYKNFLGDHSHEPPNKRVATPRPQDALRYATHPDHQKVAHLPWQIPHTPMCNTIKWLNSWCI